MRPYEIPTVAQFQALRQWLISQGMTPALLAGSVGNAPQQRANGTIAASLRARLKRLPKQTPGLAKVAAGAV